MDAAAAKKLREPFKPEQIGKLPKLNCKACSDSPGKVCPKHTKQNCKECGNWISSAHIHLDYVGHAATTDRLLSVDPTWTWEPMGIGPNGEPLMTNGGMWIKLTLCGVTRPGFGDGKNPKEIIGDAIRNAAMRFGVALDLWAKEDLHADGDGEAEPAKGSPAGTGEPPPRKQPKEATNGSAASADGTTKFASAAQRKRLFAIAKTAGVESARLREILAEVTGQESTAQIPSAKYDAVIAAVELEEVPFA